MMITLVPALAQDATPEKYLELLRSDVRTAKVEILTEAMALSQPEADAFWPIFREYQTEQEGLGDRRVSLIKQYAEMYDNMSDESASELSREWFSIHDGQVKLRKKYFKRVEKATSTKVAIRFLQVEDQINKLIDLQISSELPLIK